MLAYLCHPFYLTEGEIEGEKASIRQSKVLLALLPLFATQGKQALEAKPLFACLYP
jgi:hypothetical protein